MAFLTIPTLTIHSSGICSRLSASCLRLLFIVLLAMLGGLAVMASQNNAVRSPAVSEYNVKAAFLYHFAKYITWSLETKTQELVVCVVGIDPFGTALDALSGKRVGTAPVVIQRLQQPDNMLDCHIAFISASEQPRLNSILTIVQNTQVLTISDIPSFIEKGGMIMFHMERSKVRFSINLTAMHSAQLEISGHLLRLARQVYKSEGGTP